MGVRGQVRKRVWKMTFFCLKQGQDFENRAAQPTKNSQEHPPAGNKSPGGRISEARAPLRYGIYYNGLSFVRKIL